LVRAGKGKVPAILTLRASGRAVTILRFCRRRWVGDFCLCVPDRLLLRGRISFQTGETLDALESCLADAWIATIGIETGPRNSRAIAI